MSKSIEKELETPIGKCFLFACDLADAYLRVLSVDEENNLLGTFFVIEKQSNQKLLLSTPGKLVELACLRYKLEEGLLKRISVKTFSKKLSDIFREYKSSKIKFG